MFEEFFSRRSLEMYRFLTDLYSVHRTVYTLHMYLFTHVFTHVFTKLLTFSGSLFKQQVTKSLKGFVYSPSNSGGLFLGIRNNTLIGCKPGILVDVSC